MAAIRQWAQGRISNARIIILLPLVDEAIVHSLYTYMHISRGRTNEQYN